MNAKGEKFINEIWDDNGAKKWLDHDVPPGTEIVGIKCKVGKNAIQRLGFLLWHPPSRPTKKPFKFTGNTSMFMKIDLNP